MPESDARSVAARQTREINAREWVTEMARGGSEGWKLVGPQARRGGHFTALYAHHLSGESNTRCEKLRAPI